MIGDVKKLQYGNWEIGTEEWTNTTVRGRCRNNQTQAGSSGLVVLARCMDTWSVGRFIASNENFN